MNLCIEAEELFADKDLLYHYTKSETAIDRILPNMTLRFNNFKNLSDPREYMIQELVAIGSGDGDIFRSQDKIMEAIKNRKNNLRAASFCSNMFQIEGDKSSDIEIASSQRLPFRKVLIPFKKGYEKVRMWDQHADEYRGVCLVFNKGKILHDIKSKFDDKDYYHDYVNYVHDYLSELGSLSMDDSANNETERILNKLCFTKSIDYKDEYEYRLIVNYDEQEYYDLDINNSLKAIILGPKCDMVNESKCKKIIGLINDDRSHSDKILLLKYGFHESIISEFIGIIAT